jgi:tetratricopeptide (TPR) repeat protein
MNRLCCAVISFAVFLLHSSCVLAQPNPQTQIFLHHAEQNYRTALARYHSEPTNAEAVWQFGRASFDRAEYAANSDERASLAEAAIEACERALRHNEKNAALHYYLAMNQGQLARTKTLGALRLVRQMETEFQRTADLNPQFDYAGPDRNLGMLYFSAPGWPTSIGSNSKAKQHFLKALQIAPEYPENRLDLLEYYIKTGDDDGAQREADKYFALLPKAREQFTGEEWAANWVDWNTRWHEFEAKVSHKPKSQSPHQKK